MEKILLFQILSGAVVVGWLNFIAGYFVGQMLEKEKEEKEEDEKNAK